MKALVSGIATFLFVGFAHAEPIGYACVAGYLFKATGEKTYVGVAECKAAKIGNGFACVGGYLYLPSGVKTYVGTSECNEANMGTCLTDEATPNLTPRRR